ncbi:beta-glucanase precursor [Bacteroides graminisolvens DSM 19988 = JCM 15093]|uniref:Beta-glucanase n=1 Tax=Bacteroides graminisolvens DSM 19988 = JCM 15093 TaxID=1121097 RepID=A0A069D8C6_9BACE|nr:beta-glucanase precursor [Bacteroides graminisolvens DSM 19988 = JCM 15093]
MVKVLFLLFLLAPANMLGQSTYKLVWSDEFNKPGKPDSTVWSFEDGFVRNEELQWYQPDNAFCEKGLLIIEGRKEKVRNTEYKKEGKSWKQARKYAFYTSSSLKTAGKKEFLYGRIEVRAKIPVGGGAWPAIWTLGNNMEWPSCGEIDIMEYYRIQGIPHILLMLPGARMPGIMPCGTVKRFLLTTSCKRTRNGLLNFTSGVWIGTKKQSDFI